MMARPSLKESSSKNYNKLLTFLVSLTDVVLNVFLGLHSIETGVRRRRRWGKFVKGTLV